jgi:hypothetical protein
MIYVLCCSGVETLRYLHERIAKKIPMGASWAVAYLSSELFLFASSLMTEIGMAFMCFSSVSVLLNDLISCCRMNAGQPSSSRDGFGCPFSQKVAQTYCTVSLTVQAANLL